MAACDYEYIVRILLAYYQVNSQLLTHLKVQATHCHEM